MERFLFSIGHGARSIEDFIALLQQYGIRYLADVRTYPFSRFHPQFNRAALGQALEEEGIRYVYFGDTLGGRPKDAHSYGENGRVDYEKIQQKDGFKRSIGRLVKAAEDKIPLAMMCSERDPRQCHRSRLIGVALEREQVQVLHIDEQGHLKSQEEVMDDIRSRKGNNLFGE